MTHFAWLAHAYPQSLRLKVLELPNCKRGAKPGDALTLHRRLNDEQALCWIRRNPDPFRLIRVTDALVA